MACVQLKCVQLVIIYDDIILYLTKFYSNSVGVTTALWLLLSLIISIDFFSYSASGGIIDISSNLKELFPMDFLLKRTFLLLCPVHTFGQLFNTRDFSAIEMCNTMRKMLPEFFAYNDLFVSIFMLGRYYLNWLTITRVCSGVKMITMI